MSLNYLNLWFSRNTNNGTKATRKWSFTDVLTENLWSPVSPGTDEFVPFLLPSQKTIKDITILHPAFLSTANRVWYAEAQASNRWGRTMEFPSEAHPRDAVQRGAVNAAATSKEAGMKVQRGSLRTSLTGNFLSASNSRENYYCRYIPGYTAKFGSVAPLVLASHSEISKYKNLNIAKE